MKRIEIRLILLVLLIFMTAGAAVGDYSFSVPKAETTVLVEDDGSMTIYVSYDFVNHGQKLDFVDIGLPNDNYRLSDIEVHINDEINRNVKVTKADYSETGLRHGISVELKSAAIPKGGSGSVEVVIPNLRRNLYPAASHEVDGEEAEFVGFQFSPNYFNKKFVSGSTDYTFTISFPESVKGDAAYYYIPEDWPGESEPASWISEAGRICFQWHATNANIYTAYTFGGSFLKSVLTSTDNIIMSSGSDDSSSDDASVIDVLLGVLSCIIPIVAAVFGIVKAISKGSDKVKGRSIGTTSYFPPQVKTDGVGIKRGLTAVEAAILLEVDLERVISMILYGLSKKEVIAVTSQEPLEVEIADPLPLDLNDYEKDFIAALEEPDSLKKKQKMRDAIHRLILNTSKKVDGFSLKETREYYKSICDKAWEQVEAADTPELKSQLLGDNFGWAMLQNDPEKRVEKTFSGYDFYPPYWWWRVDPGYPRSYSHSPRPSSGSQPSSGESVSSGSSDTKRSGGSSTSKPSAMPVLPGAMFARSITDSARSLGSSMVGNMNTFKASVKNRTNPAPVSRTRGSSGSSGGSSCACACACHSCACACAGGGR